VVKTGERSKGRWWMDIVNELKRPKECNSRVVVGTREGIGMDWKRGTGKKKGKGRAGPQK